MPKKTLVPRNERKQRKNKRGMTYNDTISFLLKPSHSIFFNKRHPAMLRNLLNSKITLRAQSWVLYEKMKHVPHVLRTPKIWEFITLVPSLYVQTTVQVQKKNKQTKTNKPKTIRNTFILKI